MSFRWNGLEVPPCWRAYFLLLRQEKVAKKKATPRSAPLRGPLRYSAVAGAAQLGLRPQTVLALDPRQPVLLSTSHGDPKSVAQRNDGPILECLDQFWEKPKQIEPSLSSDVSPSPLRGAEQRRSAGGSRRGLFEGQRPEFRSRLAFRVAQGTGIAGTDLGSPSSLATFFLAKQEESTPASRAEPQANSSHAAKSQEIKC